MKKEFKKPNKRSEEFNALNNELGSFGLEPPKLYRPDQKRMVEQPKAKAKGKKAPQKQKTQLSNNEKHTRNSKKRKQKNKIRKAVYLGFVCVCLVVVAVLALLAFGFKIDNIKVENSKKYTNEQIIAVLPVEKEDSLFLMDKTAAEEKLEKNLPYVYKATITRKLPSTLVVTITQPEHIFYIKNIDKSYTLLDDNFKVLEANIKKKPKNCIEIKKAALDISVVGEKGKFTDDKLEKNIIKLANSIKEYKLDEITAIYSEGSVSNYIVYDNRIIIKLGDTSDLENKIYSALTAINKLNDSNPSAEGIMTSTGGKQVYFTENK